MLRLSIVLAAVLGFYATLTSPMTVHAQETFCDYTATAEIYADTELAIARVEIAFEAGAIVNGRYFYGIIPYYQNFSMTVGAGGSVVSTNTARSNKAPLFVQVAAGSGTFTVTDGPDLVVSDCSTTAEKSVGLPTGGFPALVVPRYEEGIDIPTWIIWDYDPVLGKGFAALTVSGEVLSKFTAPPAQNTIIASSDDGKVRFSILSTGEYQINYGPDIEGKESVVIFNAGGQVIRKYDFNLYNLGE